MHTLGAILLGSKADCWAGTLCSWTVIVQPCMGIPRSPWGPSFAQEQENQLALLEEMEIFYSLMLSGKLSLASRNGCTNARVTK